MLKKNHLIRLAAATLASSVCIASFAADNACLIEGNIVVFGTTTPAKDCLENSGVPPERFKPICQSLIEASEKLAKTFGGPPPKSTYLPACPTNAQASCVGFFGQPMTSYYYKRDAKSLAETKESCLAQGGKWRP